MTKTKYCPKCIPHEYQDKKYGKNRRVMNETRKSGAKGGAVVSRVRCTVCGAEQ